MNEKIRGNREWFYLKSNRPERALLTTDWWVCLLWNDDRFLQTNNLVLVIHQSFHSHPKYQIKKSGSDDRTKFYYSLPSLLFHQEAS